MSTELSQPDVPLVAPQMVRCPDCKGAGRGGPNTTDGSKDDDCSSCSGGGITSLERAILFIEGFADDPAQEGVREILEGLVAVNDTLLTPLELAAVRAAVDAAASGERRDPPLGRLGMAALSEKLERIAELQDSN